MTTMASQITSCLLNRIFKCRSKKTSKLRVTGLCAGNSPGPVNSPHKGPVTRKMFPFDDVIMTMAVVAADALTPIVLAMKYTRIPVVNYLCHCWVDKCHKKQIIYYASWKHQAYTEISLCIFPSYRILIMYTAGGEWGIFVYLDVRGNVLQDWYILHFLWNAKKCFYMCRE